jgi:hypothetical protein
MLWLVTQSLNSGNWGEFIISFSKHGHFNLFFIAEFAA